MKNVAYLVTSVILFTVVLCQPALAWDGYRKGFVLGFGAGFGSLNFNQEIK